MIKNIKTREIEKKMKKYILLPILIILIFYSCARQRPKKTYPPLKEPGSPSETSFQVMERLKVITERANIREKPTTIESAAIIAVPRGTLLEKLSTVGEWYQVTCMDKKGFKIKGYIYKELVETVFLPKENKPLIGTPFPSIKRLKVIVDKANIRAAPSTESPILITVLAGAKMEIVGEEEEWYQVAIIDEQGFEIVGYIHKALVDFIIN
ncbi:MAG: SH3 domain-containing protein [Methanosarcinales archaeon]